MLSEEERQIAELAIDQLACGCIPANKVRDAEIWAAEMIDPPMLSSARAHVWRKENELCGQCPVEITADERVLRLRKLLAADDVEKSGHEPPRCDVFLANKRAAKEQG